jgi:hypothetical protein
MLTIQDPLKFQLRSLFIHMEENKRYCLTVGKINLIRFSVNHATAYARYLSIAYCKYPKECNHV